MVKHYDVGMVVPALWTTR